MSLSTARKVEVKNEICRMGKYSQCLASDYSCLVKNTSAWDEGI
jgi:hypothetical protein